MSKTVIIHGNTYIDVPSVKIPLSGGSGNADFYETSDATATQADVLSTKVFYGSSGKQNGLMSNNGSTSGTISTKTGTVSIPSGYTSGGTVKIDDAEQAKIIADNIKSGVTILGQPGKSSVVDTAISSSAASSANILSGYKAYVNGQLITGGASMPVISQDTTTKVLSIS